MITAGALHGALAEAGFGPFTGVPCSYLGPLISYVQDRHPDQYLAANNEGEAVAIAAGARLAGRNPVVILQNSGLGNAVNPLTSLCHTLRIPVLMLVTWRGEPGRPDEPQHELMGRVTHDMLDLMEIPNLPLPEDDGPLRPRVRAAAEHLDTTGRPFAFVVRKGALAPHPIAGPATGPGLMLRREAIEQVVAAAPAGAAIVATTGKTGRELETEWDRPANLYIVGSMGCASSVALGVAVHAPDRPVIVLDGDGAALMRLEALAGIGAHRPANLLHVVLDNRAHESTGGQPTLSAGVDLAAVALACGYRWVQEISDAALLRESIAAMPPGPGLVRVFIRTGSDPGLGRPRTGPADVAARFGAALAAGPAGAAPSTLPRSAAGTVPRDAVEGAPNAGIGIAAGVPG